MLIWFSPTDLLRSSYSTWDNLSPPPENIGTPGWYSREDKKLIRQISWTRLNFPPCRTRINGEKEESQWPHNKRRFLSGWFRLRLIFCLVESKRNVLDWYAMRGKYTFLLWQGGVAGVQSHPFREQQWGMSLRIVKTRGEDSLYRYRLWKSWELLVDNLYVLCLLYRPWWPKHPAVDGVNTLVSAKSA